MCTYPEIQDPEPEDFDQEQQRRQIEYEMSQPLATYKTMGSGWGYVSLERARELEDIVYAKMVNRRQYNFSPTGGFARRESA